MVEDPQAITYLGETNFRNRNTRFGIKTVDRSRHMYVIGKSGTGKSTFLETLAIQDIERGSGLAFVDPHGGSAVKLLEYIPEWRKQDVVYFAPFDMDFPISFNVMEDVGKDRRHLVSNGLMSAFKKIWVDAWSARMEYILNNILLALLEYPEATILGVNRMLSDKDYRKLVVANVQDPSVKSFWMDEFARYSDKYMQEAGAAIQNKIGQFVTNPLIRNIVGQPKSSFDFRRAMDERKILIINLSKGQMGDQNASLLGAMLITKIYLSAMSRADLPSHVMATMPSFYFYADEFQNFANESFANILSEARKYKLCLTLAHQYVEQLPEELQSAVFGNVGSMVVFRVGAQDAEIFEKEFAPVFVQEDFTNLAFRHMYLRISIDGVGSKPFSATTLMISPNTAEGAARREQIIQLSQKTFAHPREEVEKAIQEWYGPSAMAGNTPPPGGDDRPKFPPRSRSDAPQGEARPAPRPPMDPAKPTFSSRDNGPKISQPAPGVVAVKAPVVQGEIPREAPKPAPQQTAKPSREVLPQRTSTSASGPVVSRTQNQTPAPLSKPPSAPERKPEAKPVSSALSDLLNKLDGDDGKAPLSKPTASSGASANFNKSPQTSQVSSNSVSNQSLVAKAWNDRSASDGSKQSLKDALAKALASAPKKVSSPAPASVPIPQKPPSAPERKQEVEIPVYAKLSDLPPRPPAQKEVSIKDTSLIPPRPTGTPPPQGREEIPVPPRPEPIYGASTEIPKAPPAPEVPPVPPAPSPLASAFIPRTPKEIPENILKSVLE